MPGDESITTSVDMLLDLINEHGEMTTVKAAESLDFSHELIEDWAETLEASGLIKIKYGFRGTYLLTPERAAMRDYRFTRVMQSVCMLLPFSRWQKPARLDSRTEDLRRQNALLDQQLNESRKYERLLADAIEAKEKANELLARFNEEKMGLEAEKQKISEEKRQVSWELKKLRQANSMLQRIYEKESYVAPKRSFWRNAKTPPLEVVPYN